MSYPDDHVRVGNVQRERAVELLRQAAADGRVDFDELDARLPQALQARTQGELRPVISDLVPTADLTNVLSDDTPQSSGPGSTWDDPLMLRADIRQSIKLEGRWQVPPFIEIHCTMWGTVRLDFQHAVPLAPVIDIVLVAADAGVTLVVPEGWGVDTERVRVSASFGTFTSKVSSRPQRGKPRIILSGNVASGSVRLPRPGEQRRAARLVEQGSPQLGIG